MRLALVLWFLMQLAAAVQAALQQNDRETGAPGAASVSDDPVRNQFMMSLQQTNAPASSSSEGVKKVSFGFAALRNAVGGAWLG